MYKKIKLFLVKKPIVVVLTLPLLVYHLVVFGFFQQDEWLAFGNFFASRGNGASTTIIGFFSPNIGHYVPLHQLVFYTLVSFFGINYVPYALFSIGAHLLITSVVYLIAKSLFKDKKHAAIGALFFGVAYAGVQATSWILADINTHGASLFGLLSIYFIVLYSKKLETRFIYFSTILLIISLLFKETTIALTLLNPLLLIVLRRGVTRDLIVKAMPFVALGVAYALLRISFFFLPTAQSASVITQSQSIGDLVYNLITFPAKSVMQILVPTPLLLSLSHFLANLLPTGISGEPLTTQRDLFVLHKVFELLNIAGFLLIIFFSWKHWRRHKLGAVVLYGFAFVILNSFIIAFSPERSGIIGVVDSRNLYLLVFGVVVLLLSFLSRFGYKSIKLLTIVAIIVAINVFYIQKELSVQATKGSTRDSVLSVIKATYPNLPDKVVFFMESDTSYFGLPENTKILPFQSGLGQTLLAWYHPSENFPLELFAGSFLWEIQSEGYKEIRGQGFGYVRTKDALKQVVLTNNLSSQSVIAFSWNSETGELYDITAGIRKELETNQ